MRNFLECIRTRKTPNGDIELGYRVQVSLIMAMSSYVEGKVAYFDAATETIRMIGPSNPQGVPVRGRVGRFRRAVRLTDTKGEKVAVSYGGRTLLEYRYTTARPKPYIHPLYLSGRPAGHARRPRRITCTIAASWWHGRRWTASTSGAK